MSKAILISIKPQWVAKILNGEKTIEIRKTCPEIFKHLKPYEGCSIDVYIYVTNDKKEKLFRNLGTKKYVLIHCKDTNGYNGKVIAKFTLNKVKETKPYMDKEQQKLSCLSTFELMEYLQGKTGYAWHIDNLVIFDYTKEICEFKHTTKKHYYNADFDYEGVEEITLPLTKAPQSWCYIEV